MKKLLIAGILTVVSGSASALDYNVSAGITNAGTPPNGIWWQNGYDHSFQSNVPSVGARVDQRFGDWGVGLGYEYIGDFASHASAVASDAAYAAGTPYPTSNWYGHQINQGLFLAARRYIGDFYVEAGPMLSYTKFSMNIPDWMGAKPDTNTLVSSGIRSPIALNQRSYSVQWIASVGYKIDQHYSALISYIPLTTGAEMPGITAQYGVNLSLQYTF